MKALKFYKKYGIFVLFLIEVIIFSFLSKQFMTWTNIMNLIRQVSMLGIVVTGVTMIMIGGGTDLSIGAQMALGGLFVAEMIVNRGFNPFLAGIIGLGFGALMGVLNGVLIVKLNIFPLVVTLGTMTIIQGAAYLITGGYSIYGLPDNFKFFGQGYIGPVPFPVIVFITIVIIFTVIMGKTYFGRHVYAMGGNYEAARLAGINVRRLRVAVYALSGLLTGIASTIMLARTNSAQPSTASTYAFDCMTAAVLGGVSFAGGSGSILGGVMGVIIIGTLENGLILMGVNEYWKEVIKGVILIGAVALDNIERKSKKAD